MAADAPLVCRLDALTKPERARHAGLVRRLAASVRSVQELPRGFALRFADEDALSDRLVEWMALERRCCPFLEIDLLFGDPGEALLLRVTGRADGAKEFLEAELAPLLARPRPAPDPPRAGRRTNAP